MPLAVTHNAEASRFEARLDDDPGHLAICSYRRVGDTLVLHHTEVPWALQGRGLAGELVQGALDWARAHGLRVRPTCSYVAAYMQRHPETHDLLENNGDRP
jgi:predicted GNAT family acetyltransferase